MIPPAQITLADSDVVEGMVEVGGPHAKRVKCQPHSGGFPEPGDEKADCSGDFGDAGEGNDLWRERHP